MFGYPFALDCKEISLGKCFCYKVNPSTSSVLEVCDHMFSSKVKMLVIVFLNSGKLRSFTTLLVFG